MKKRLRKKLRLGEFRENCFELSFIIDPSINEGEADTLFDEFIEMIERNKLQYGGGGDTRQWTGIVQGAYRTSALDRDRQSVLGWLRAHPHIIEATAGPLRDAWYGWD